MNRVQRISFNRLRPAREREIWVNDQDSAQWRLRVEFHRSMRAELKDVTGFPAAGGRTVSRVLMSAIVDYLLMCSDKAGNLVYDRASAEAIRVYFRIRQPTARDALAATDAIGLTVLISAYRRRLHMDWSGAEAHWKLSHMGERLGEAK